MAAAAGLALAPTAALLLFAAARTLGSVGTRSGAAGWFLAGFGGYAVFYFLDLARFRFLYVLAHELTHAAAAWLGGAKVHRLVVKRESGRIDLSRSNALVALAPYWVPLYSLLLVGAYRIFLWAKPGGGGRELFLFLMGATMSFHLMHTAESIWSAHQDDLDELGLPLSMVLISVFNGLFLLSTLKCLFPRLVTLSAEFEMVWRATRGFWGWIGGLSRLVRP